MRPPMLMTVCSVSAVLNLLPETVLAQDSKSILFQQNNQGWSSTMGLYFISSKGKSSSSNIVVDSKPTYTSLNTDSFDYDYSTIFPTLRVNYTNPTSTSFSMGLFDTGLTTNNLIDTQSVVDLTIHHTLDNESIVWSSYSPNVSGLYKVWQDPYQTGEPLEKTDVSLHVLAVGIEYIMGTPLSISASIGEQKIEKERAGEGFGTNLNSNEIKLLNRDVIFGKSKISLTQAVADHLFLEGGLSYYYADAEGKANSFNATGIDLSLSYFHDSIEAYLTGGIQQIEFAAANPVFNRKRDEKGYDVHIGARYKNIFGWDNTSIDTVFSVSNRSSNIHFFDEENVTLSVGVSYAI